MQITFQVQSELLENMDSEVAISEFENYATEQVSSEQDPKCKLISTGQKIELGDGFYLEVFTPQGIQMVALVSY